MWDTLADIASAEVARFIVEVAAAIFLAVGSLAALRLRKWLGEEQTNALLARLEPAIDRALARAEASGLTGEAMVMHATNYLHQTLEGTLKGLRSPPADIRARVSAQAIAAGYSDTPARPDVAATSRGQT